MTEIAHVTVDEFFAQHAVVPFQATIEPGSEAGKVTVTPWTVDGGCNCGAALELPKSTIAKVQLAGIIHRCCGKGLQVVNVVFSAEHQAVLTAAFAALRSRSESVANVRRRPPAYCEEFCNSGIDCNGVIAYCNAKGDPWACAQAGKCRACRCQPT